MSIYNKVGKMPLSGKIGGSPALTVIMTPCPVCAREFSKGDMMIAVGANHFLLVHYDCFPLFDPFAPYSHGKPLRSFLG
jgi:hypothetical protein